MDVKTYVWTEKRKRVDNSILHLHDSERTGYVLCIWTILVAIWK